MIKVIQFTRHVGVREDFSEKVTFRLRFEAGVEVSQGKAGGEEHSRVF